jgi:hypothetical protein
MQRAKSLRGLRPILLCGVFALVCLLVYGYYRGLIDQRRKTYIDEAVVAFSLASDRLDSQLANRQSVVARADAPPLRSKNAGAKNTPKKLDEQYFREYVDKLIPDLDPADCTGLPEKRPKPGSAEIFAIREQAALRFRFMTSVGHCAQTNPELLTAIVKGLPDVVEDTLLVASDGSVQNQSARIGPRITKLDGLINISPQMQGDSGLRSILGGLMPGTAKTPPAEPLETFRSWIEDAHRRRVHDFISFSSVAKVQFAGEVYLAIVQPIPSIQIKVRQQQPDSGFSENQNLAFVGLMRDRNLEAKASVWPIATIAWAGIGLVFIYSVFFLISCLPMKAPLQRIHRWDFVWMIWSAMACSVGLTLTVTHSYFVLFERNGAIKDDLHKLATQMADNVEEELCRLNYVLDDLNDSREFYDARKAFYSERPSPYQLVTKLLNPADQELAREFRSTGVVYSYPFFDYVFWSSNDGRQIAKWSIHDLTTPETRMREFPWFLEARDGRLFELRASDAERRRLLRGGSAGVYVEPIYSPNTGEFLTLLLKKYTPPKGTGEAYVGLIVAPIASLNEPIFPPSYGFDVVRRNGDVLFSSRPNRNLRLNLAREFKHDGRLQSALDANVARTMQLQHDGADLLLHVHPFDSLDGAGWSIVTYRELNRDQGIETSTFIQAIKLMVPHELIMGGLVLLLPFWLRRHHLYEWLNPARIHESFQLCVVLLAVAVFTWFMISTGSRSRVFIELLSVSVISTVFALNSILRRRRVATILALSYPMVAILNGLLDARGGHSLKLDIGCGIMSILICGFTFRIHEFTPPGEPPEPCVAAPSKHGLVHFTALACMMLAVSVILPTIGYYRVAFRMVHTSEAMQDLMTTTRALEKRTLDALRYYSDVKLPKSFTDENSGVLPGSIPPETERFVRDKLRRNNDRYDTVTAHALPHIAFPKVPSDLTAAHVHPEDGIEWIDRIAFKLAFANLLSSEDLAGEPARHEVRGRIDGSTPEQHFYIDRNAVQLDYQGEWLRQHSVDKSLDSQTWQTYRSAVAVPDGGQARVLWVGALIVAVLIFIPGYFLLKLLFLIDFRPPPVLPEIESSAVPLIRQNAMILCLDGSQGTLNQLENVEHVDMRNVRAESDVKPFFSSLKTPVVLENFEVCSDSAVAARAKLLLLEDLLFSGNRPVIILATVDPLMTIDEALGEDADETLELTKFFKETRSRWVRAFLYLEVLRLKTDQFARLKSEGEQTLVRRIRESCTNAQRAVLYQIVTDGFANPKNDRALAGLIARGWVTLGPLPQLAPELGFMNGQLNQFADAEEVRRWQAREDSHWTWAVTIATLLVLAGLVVAGPDLFQSVPGGLGALAAAIPALLGAGSQLKNRFASVSSDKGTANA